MPAVNPIHVLNAVNCQRSKMLVLLKQLVCFESPSSDARSQIEIKEVISKELKQIGFKVRCLPGTKCGGNLYARPKSRINRHKTQLLLGHIDTVWPIGTLKRMPYIVEDNIVKGPGVFDMKCGIVQMLMALTALKELGYTPEIIPLIFLNSDEEIGSHESSRTIRRLAGIVDRTFVLEPALGLKGALKTRRKGVGRFTVKVHGKAAHAGLDPGLGASAILELSHVIQKLFAMNDVGKGITVNVGMIDGGIRPNVIAPVSTAVVDVRVLHREDIPGIENAIRGIKPEIDNVEVEITGRIGRPPLEKNERNNNLWQSVQQCANRLNIEISQAVAGGGSDGSTTNQYTATLDGLGAVGDGAHADHEFVYIDKSIERAALLALLIMEPPLQQES